MKLRDIELANGLFLGPMAGYTDRVMRQLCRMHGADMTVTEMVSAKAVCYKDKKTATLARIFPDERPAALQLFGSEPAVLAEAAVQCERGVSGYAPPSAIDINMGCPMRKIISQGEGGALMKNPHAIEKIVSAVRQAVKLPVTVKIRSGWDEQGLNAVECAKAAEAGGADMICVHGRTVKQVYTGQADWSVIREVKQAVAVPVVGNGDITDAASAKQMIAQTGVDGIMVARATLGNPFLFGEIRAALEGQPYTPPTLRERVDTALLQLRMSIEDKGEKTAIPASRGPVAAYVYGVYGAAEVRHRVNCAKTYQEVEAILYDFLEKAERYKWAEENN